MRPIVPSSPAHAGSTSIKPADNSEMTPKQARIEEEARHSRVHNPFEDPATSGPAKET